MYHNMAIYRDIVASLIQHFTNSPAGRSDVQSLRMEMIWGILLWTVRCLRKEIAPLLRDIDPPSPLLVE